MKITLLGHSGFAVELESTILVFDYFTDEKHIAPKLPFNQKNAVFFASHAHSDHFNKRIFQFAEPGRTAYVLGEGIGTHGRKDAVVLAKGESAARLGVNVKAFGSTDEGVSFLVEAEGKKIFHAGDLNDWYWEDESTPEELKHDEQWFLDEIAPLAGAAPDVAFIPADARLGKHALRGAGHFVRVMEPARAVLMHLSGGYALPGEFRRSLARDGIACEVLELAHAGDTITME